LPRSDNNFGFGKERLVELSFDFLVFKSVESLFRKEKRRLPDPSYSLAKARTKKKTDGRGEERTQKQKVPGMRRHCERART